MLNKMKKLTRTKVYWYRTGATITINPLRAICSAFLAFTQEEIMNSTLRVNAWILVTEKFGVRQQIIPNIAKV